MNRHLVNLPYLSNGGHGDLGRSEAKPSPVCSRRRKHALHPRLENRVQTNLQETIPQSVQSRQDQDLKSDLPIS